MDNTTPIKSSKRVVLDLPPSCVRFCPANPAYFVVGTYNLEAAASQEASATVLEGSQAGTCGKHQNRNGSLILFRSEGPDLSTVQTEAQPSALLDLAFYPQGTGLHSILAVVSSTGTLAIFSLDTLRRPALQLLATSRCDDLGEEVLFLQCSWHASIEKLIAVTTSTGLARLLQLDNEWCIKGWRDLSIGNALEAWSVNLATSDGGNDGARCRSTMVFCGGDDSKLRFMPFLWDVSNDVQKILTLSPPFTVKNYHNAGVTAILPLSYWAQNGGRIVLTGSYDDRLRVFAMQDSNVGTHAGEKVQLLSEIDLGGGVWRLNLIESSREPPGTAGAEFRVLASCMHAGARIVKITARDGDVWECSVVARFEEHQSMNYASDAVSTENGCNFKCISTSFYDRLLCQWSYDAQAAASHATIEQKVSSPDSAKKK